MTIVDVAEVVMWFMVGYVATIVVMCVVFFVKEWLS